MSVNTSSTKRMCFFIPCSRVLTEDKGNEKPSFPRDSGVCFRRFAFALRVGAMGLWSGLDVEHDRKPHGRPQDERPHSGTPRQAEDARRQKEPPRAPDAIHPAFTTGFPFQGLMNMGKARS